MKSAYIKNDDNELISCQGCGRDTREISGFCFRCYPSENYNKSAYQINDEADRKPLQVFL